MTRHTAYSYLVTVLISSRSSIIKELFYFLIAFYPHHNKVWNSKSESTNMYNEYKCVKNVLFCTVTKHN